VCDQLLWLQTTSWKHERGMLVKRSGWHVARMQPPSGSVFTLVWWEVVERRPCPELTILAVSDCHLRWAQSASPHW